MRRVYRLGEGKANTSPEDKGSPRTRSGRTSELGTMEKEGEDGFDFDEMNEIEREAEELYQWTQELSFEDIT